MNPENVILLDKVSQLFPFIIAIVALTGDRGLAGPFNAQILRRAFALERELRGERVADTGNGGERGHRHPMTRGTRNSPASGAPSGALASASATASEGRGSSSRSRSGPPASVSSP